MMNKKKLDKIKQESYDSGVDDGESSSLWVMTFGDLFTLLLTFFIMLLSISVPNEKKFQEALKGIQKALIKNVGKPEEKTMTDQLKSMIKDNNIANVVSIEHTSRGIKLIIAGDFSFKSGEAALTPNKIKLLDEIAAIISSTTNKVEISAHTDINPINTELYPSNWELSSARASAIAKYFVETRNIQGARILAIGAAEYKPRFLPPDKIENLEKNRRVEIELLNEGL